MMMMEEPAEKIRREEMMMKLIQIMQVMNVNDADNQSENSFSIMNLF